MSLNDTCKWGLPVTHSEWHTPPTLTESELNEMLLAWMNPVSRKLITGDRIWRYRGNLYFTKGRTLYRLPLKWRIKTLTGSNNVKPWTHRARIAIARCEPKHKALYVRGKYAQWAGGYDLPTDWESLYGRISKLVFNFGDEPSTRNLCKVIPVYHLPQSGRKGINHQQNEHAYDKLVLYLNKRLRRTRKHQGFFVSAIRQVLLEANAYEAATRQSLGIITRPEYVVAAFKDKLT